MIGGSRPSVLVVDDDETTRALVAEILTLELDVTVRGAADGRAGILSIAADPPSLILLDMKMRDLDGMAVLHWLKSKPRTAAIPVLALTATANWSTLQALERRCDGLLTKPFDVVDLVDRVRQLLELGGSTGATPLKSAV